MAKIKEERCKQNWYLVTLAYLGHGYLLVLLSLSFQRWCLLAPLRDCWAQHPFGTIIPLGRGYAW